MQKKLAAVFPALDEIGASIDNAVIESPVLRIGDDAMTTAEILVPALRALRKKYPNLSVSLNQNTSHGSFQELKEEIIDCALTAAPAPDKDLVSVKVMEQNVGIVVPEGHPLYGFAEVRLSELHPASKTSRASGSISAFTESQGGRPLRLEDQARSAKPMTQIVIQPWDEILRQDLDHQAQRR